MQFSKPKEMDEEELSKKMKEKENEILQYLMPRNGLPQDMTTEIMTNIKHDKLKDKLDSEVDMDLLFYLLPYYIEVSIKQHVGMNALKKVCFQTSSIHLKLILILQKKKCKVRFFFSGEFLNLLI